MASSVSGQDEPNRTLWLATQTGKMERLLGTTRSILQAKFHHHFVSVHKHAKKELGQYPAILASHLVNNPYLMSSPLALNKA